MEQMKQPLKVKCNVCGKKHRRKSFCRRCDEIDCPCGYCPKRLGKCSACGGSMSEVTTDISRLSAGWNCYNFNNFKKGREEMSLPKLQSKLRFKFIGTWSKEERKIRLFKWTWATGDDCSVKDWHSSSFKISLWPKIFKYEPELWGWALTILFMRFHRKRAYGGWL